MIASSPTLIDGELAVPAAGPIAIGGANTFRNVGLDLGVTQPVSRLEISVDTVSDPGLVWRVFRSRDNLVWDEVDGVLSRTQRISFEVGEAPGPPIQLYVAGVLVALIVIAYVARKRRERMAR